MAFDIYAEVTEKIVAMLESGVVPWRNPILGQQNAGWPKNTETDREYRGVNVFLLAMTAWCKGYESAYWITFNQAKQRGGSVRKGGRGNGGRDPPARAADEDDLQVHRVRLELVQYLLGPLQPPDP